MGKSVLEPRGHLIRWCFSERRRRVCPPKSGDYGGHSVPEQRFSASPSWSYHTRVDTFTLLQEVITMSVKESSKHIKTAQDDSDLGQSVRQQMQCLRRDNRRLRQECEILKKARD